jgi:hypothetical protein
MIVDNTQKPIKDVLHSELERFGDGRYKSKCPECLQGLLLIRRNSEKFYLEELDNCVFCGQMFRYLDIENLRAKDIKCEKC